MKLRFFDFEVTPNWWECTFGDLLDDSKDPDESIKETFVTITSDSVNAREEICNQMFEKDTVLVGYNIKSYDLIIANGIYQGFSPKLIKILNDLIIIPDCEMSSKEHWRMSAFKKKKIRNVVYQDLMDDNNGTLKEKEATFGLSILESSVDFNKEFLTEQDKMDMTFYNRHDVYACMILYTRSMKGYVKNKLAIGRKFNIPIAECYASTNAKLVSRALGAERTSFSDAELIEIFLPKKIQRYCYDNLPSKILDKLRNDTKSFSINLFNNEVSFGNGGIHSVYSKDLYVESDDEWCLVNVDAASYYPSMLIQFECLSRAVKNPKVFENIFNERIYLKHKEDKTPEEDDIQLADKLVLNTTFGASGNKWLDLFDPYMCTRCCRLGQIFLASLACKLVREVPDLKVIQSNTDGILVYVKRKYLNLVQKLQDEWTSVSGINMDRDDVEKIWQRDVNNYLLVKDSGKIKRKGLWLMETWTKPGYFLISPLTAFVCSKAAINFYINGDDIVRSIVKNEDLLDFCITCKKGPSYKGVIQRFADGTEKQLFKCNRVIATKDQNAGQILKYKDVKGRVQFDTMASIPLHCKLVNDDLSTYNFNEIRKELDYMYYVQRALDLIDIDWSQLDRNNLYKIDKFKI